MFSQPGDLARGDAEPRGGGVGTSFGPRAASGTSRESAPTRRCLVRAVGSKQKISCMLAAKDYRRFMKAYGNILKISLDAGLTGNS